MKVTRISKLKGYRLFHDFVWPSDLQAFGRFNLIYGWNGTGKTTLAALFRALQDRIAVADCEAVIEVDDRQIKGCEVSSAVLPPVRVFNRDFVNATITAAVERVDPIYYLGEESIEKQAKADELRKQMDAALEELTSATAKREAAAGELDRFSIDKAKVIKELLTNSQSTQYNNYDKRTFKRSMAALQYQSDATASLLSYDQKEQHRKQKDSQPKADLAAIACTPPDFAKLSREAKALLDRSVASETLEALAQDKEVAAWVQQGLRLHSGEQKTNTCRFCLQPLSVERRAALDGHFNDAFSSFQQEISETIAGLLQKIQNLSGVTFPDSARAYDHLQGELATAARAAQKAIDAATAWLEKVRGDLDAKKAEPLTASENCSWQDTVPSSDDMSEAIAKVNAIIEKHNSVTSDFRAKVNEACKRLEEHYVAEVWDEHKRLFDAVTAAENAINPLRDDVDRLRRTIADIERDIVEHQRPADELNNELKAYLGRDELRFEVKGTGYCMTRNGQPASDLSEGEKTAIAFLYYLKSLQDKSFDLTNGVVVIDDPVSSLDANALFSAFGYMKERTKDAGQLFVLTHNFCFFRQVKNWYHYINRSKAPAGERPLARLFLLTAVGAGDTDRKALLGPIDRLLEDFDSEYHYLFKRVMEEAARVNGVVPLGDRYSMPNLARRLVEAFLAFRYPDCSGNNALYAALERVNFDTGKKTRILRFVNTYSHSGRISDADEDPWALAETGVVLQDVLDLIRAEDPAHFDGMVNRIGQVEVAP